MEPYVTDDIVTPRILSKAIANINGGAASDYTDIANACMNLFGFSDYCLDAPLDHRVSGKSLGLRTMLYSLEDMGLLKTCMEEDYLPVKGGRCGGAITGF